MGPPSDGRIINPCYLMLDDELRAELESRRERGLARALRIVPLGALDLASNDYLGLARDACVIEAVASAAREFGAGARASRLVSGQTALHEQLEAALAAWKECEAALVFSSGWAANVAAVSSLARRGDGVFCDKRNHASLVDACRLAEAGGARVRYYESFSRLHNLLERSEAPRKIIVSDAVYSMDGDLADVPTLLGFARKYDAVLILDDAHGTGTLGARGRGALEWWRERATGVAEFDGLVRDVSIVQTGTLSKALGSQGGFVAASATVVEYLVNAARSFVYSTGLNPAAAGAALESLRIIEKEPDLVQRLLSVKSRLATGLREQGWDVREQPTPILSVLIGQAPDAVNLSARLLKRGVWCPAIRPPTVPAGTSRLRVTASAALSDSDIENALAAFAAEAPPSSL